jgi:ABC-2 type transport system permease protein
MTDFWITRHAKTVTLCILAAWVAAGVMTFAWTDFGKNTLVLVAVFVVALALLLLLAGLAMRNLYAITRREIGSFFLSPVAWVVLTVFLVAFGAIFCRFLGLASMAPTFYFMSIVMAFVVPMLTMRQIAEERKSGTIEMLTTAPVTDVELVLGKFLGALVFFLFMLLPTAAYVWVLFHYSTIGPDKWMLAAGYLGTLLMGAFMLSFGLFLSSVSREQIVVAVVGAMSLFLLWLLGYFLPMNPSASLAPSFWSTVQAAAYRVGSFVAFTRHLEGFSRGEVDSREVVFFLSFTAFFLFLAVATVSTRKWR